MNQNYLVIFDVDGTLTQSIKFDSEAFAHTFSEFFGLNEIDSNWDQYKYSTDSGFALELFEKYLHRIPLDTEVAIIKTSFLDKLTLKINNDPHCCLPVPGADLIFKKLQQLHHFDLAIATGCWKASAVLKLEHANIPYHSLPLATADDHIERSHIIHTAIERSIQYYQKPAYQKIFYIGDRLWDYQATQLLGINFIGIGRELLNANLKKVPILSNYLSDTIVDFIKA